jgi:hypothetical protein
MWSETQPVNDKAIFMMMKLSSCQHYFTFRETILTLEGTNVAEVKATLYSIQLSACARRH